VYKQTKVNKSNLSFYYHILIGPVSRRPVKPPLAKSQGTGKWTKMRFTMDNGGLTGDIVGDI
jgi:hypothetical protein